MNEYTYQVKRGEIYFANLDPVVGCEHSGRRPVVILQNNVGNKHSPTTIIATITTNLDKAYLPNVIVVHTKCLSKPSAVLLGQIRTIDKTRLDEYVGQLDNAQMVQIDRAIVVSLGIKYLEELLT